ncbi:uncharacterized protein N7525_010103 [Penicillium rubens]|uniref:uncharacterized protein n=1 Tax=Penicillium rubens TaxID=1108849 RepID=UPI002A59FAA9|nr:uncharacterized protein N7525_010103 [Penicillium rubens]KAJ5820819.1 hypothetical protein N7525_010103 [Penicillium rubens]
MVKSCDSIQWRYTATSLRSMQNPARDAKPLNTDKALVLAHHWLYWCASASKTAAGVSRCTDKGLQAARVLLAKLAIIEYVLSGPGICQICGLLSDRHGLRPQYAVVPRHTPGDIRSGATFSTKL